MASREGFHLMDVETAPLLVKRRGMKRRGSRYSRGFTDAQQPSIGRGTGKTPLGSVLEVAEPSTSSQKQLAQSKALGPTMRPTTLDMAIGSKSAKVENTPGTVSTVFTVFRDPEKPPYLRYSRDDICK